MGIEIAIDGPSGSGKSTIAKTLAAKLGFAHIDTGAMYRAVALHATGSGKNLDDEAAVMATMESINIDIAYTSTGQRIFLAGDDVTEAVRTAEIGVGASIVAAYGMVRQKLVDLQRKISKSRNVVMDGRDIGTVVLPDALVKIFLTASLEKRAERRCNELSAMGLAYDFDDILKQIEKRDFDDTNRASSPLKCAPDAVVVDTSNMSIQEAVKVIIKIIEEKGILNV